MRFPPIPTPARVDPAALEDWRDGALCRGMDTLLFFPVQGESRKLAYAKQVCAACPVREACLDYALDANEEHGVWGGLSMRERARLKRSGRHSLSA